MPNQSGSVYGLTILSPILSDPHLRVAHKLQIRMYLSTLHTHTESPFAKVTSTHLARLVVMDDVVYVGMPACEEHLQSAYLIFESNFDGDLDTYLTRMAREIPDLVDGVWGHCVGYPGVKDVATFIAYMKKCQITTTFFFADVNDKTVQQALKALQTQAALSAFIEAHQGRPAAEVQAEFTKLLSTLQTIPAPPPGEYQTCSGHCYALTKRYAEADNEATPRGNESLKSDALPKGMGGQA